MSTPEEPTGTVVEAVKLEAPLLRLMTEPEILEREARLLRAKDAARRLAQPLQESPDVLRLLAEQGVPPELADRARIAVQEDRAYTQAQAARAHAQVIRLHDQHEKAEAELTRRQHLPPDQRQAEAAERARQRAARAPQTAQYRPVQQPALTGPAISPGPRQWRS
ncbi:hypothetical protein ACNPQM_21470 [Streptomyces sp. NPDC056231]|uniref:hypothetical protein n=1 Tax=Streptomyces sp. NPDC056231 TaxID=3345755 RepID=UPI003AAE65DE